MEEEKVQRYNVCAIISFVCSLIGLFKYGIIFGIASLVLGIIGVRKCKKDNEKGKWMAIVGIILGVIEIIYFIFVVALAFSIFSYNSAL